MTEVVEVSRRGKVEGEGSGLVSWGRLVVKGWRGVGGLHGWFGWGFLWGKSKRLVRGAMGDGWGEGASDWPAGWLEKMIAVVVCDAYR